MRILVLGARGMLGTDILNEWQSDELIPAGSADADIRYFPEVEKLLLKVRPNWIILSAAYTDVDGCERNPELAFAVNATGVENLARAAELVAARIFLVSTDYVFDGKATRPYETHDPVAPLNVYGASKAAGEAALRNSHSSWCIGRTSWLFGVHGPSFPEKIIRVAIWRAPFVIWFCRMLAGLFTLPTKELVPGLILLARFFLSLDVGPFRFFPSAPSNPPGARCAPTILFSLHPACMPAEFAPARGKKRYTRSCWKKTPRQIQVSCARRALACSALLCRMQFVLLEHVLLRFELRDQVRLEITHAKS